MKLFTVTILVLTCALTGCKDNTLAELPDCPSISSVVIAKYNLPLSTKVDQSIQDACQKGRGMYYSGNTYEYDSYRKKVDMMIDYAEGDQSKIIHVIDDATTAGYMLQKRLMKKAP